MLFNTPEFLVFFVIVVGIYWIIPGKARKVWLLVCSYYFYMQWNKIYILLLLGTTLITYFTGLCVDSSLKKQDVFSLKDKNKKVIFVIAITVCLGTLFVFKYVNFSVELLNMLKKDLIMWKSDLLLPVGISFYILQSVGYIIDVYRGEIYAEKNILKYALFVSFFPQLVAGPIERSKNLLTQMSTEKKFSYDNLRTGLITMLWGFFLKMVIADRAATMVDYAYEHLDIVDGVQIIIASMLFSIQIYCDFCGYSTIARGVAKTMGYNLVDNFDAPYFSKSIKEFWRRWHISLSTWFRDYVYIPLGGNRKGKARKNINLMLVFGLSGLWHGASLGYVLWGLINGGYQVVADVIKPIRARIKCIAGWTDCLINRVFATLSTFILVTFAWVFFRAGNISNAINVFNSIKQNGVHLINFINGSIYNLGLDKCYVKSMMWGIVILTVVDYFKFKKVDIIAKLVGQYWIGRFAVELFIFFFIILYGQYGTMYETTAFIYFQF